MKKIYFLLIFSLLLFYSCQHKDKENKAYLTVEFPALADEEISLLRLSKSVPEQVAVLHGSETVAINLDSPDFFSLQNGKEKIFFILHPGDSVKITSPDKTFGKNYHLEGSKDSKILQAFIAYVRKEDAQRDSLIQWREAAKDSVNFYEIKQKIDSAFISLLKKRQDYVQTEIEKHPASLANLLLIHKPFGMQRALDEREFFHTYHLLDTALYRHYPGNYWVQEYHDKMKKLRLTLFDEFTRSERLQPGKAAPNIVLYDTADKRYSVKGYAYRKEPVLLYFWASWNEKSHAYNKKLKENYRELFEKNGIPIMAVSLDNSKKVWKITIDREKLPWLNVSDLKGLDSEVMEAYNLNRQRIPYFYFVNEKRRIVFHTQDIDSCLMQIRQWQNQRYGQER